MYDFTAHNASNDDAEQDEQVIFRTTNLVSLKSLLWITILRIS